MAIKLPLQIRFLSHSLPLSHFPSMMKSGPIVYSSRSLPVLCRALPFRFRLHGLSTRTNQQGGCRGFSTRPIRSRGEVRASKSLIEDEAELSDWVGELKSDSNRGRRFSSDDDGTDVDRARSKGRDRDGDRNRGREPFPTKRGRVNESGESTRRGTRDSGKSSWNQRFGVDDRGSKDSRDDYSSGHGGKSPRSSFGDRKDRKLDSGFGRDRDSRRTDRNSNFGSRRENGFVKKERNSDSGFGRDRDSRTERNPNFGSRRENGFVKKERNSDSGFSRENGFVKKDRDVASGFRRENGLARKGRNSDSGFGRDKGLREGKKNPSVVARFKEDEDDSDDESDDDSDDESDDDGAEMVRGGIQDLVSEEDSEDIDDDDVILRKKASSALGFSEEVGEKDNTKSSPEQSKSYLSDTRFDQFALSPLSLKAIKDAGYEKMTVVQEASLPLILKGKDVLAKAKTGTGKTVAFLLPSIEVVVKTPPVDRDNKRPPIYVLVICPTRELAIQAAAEADRLLKYHTSIGVQAVMGGTRLASEQKRIQANPCQILVATPGRLKDHIENTAGFATKLMGVKVLVLDEADHLLDMGFRKDIERIVAAVPKQRQTLLFSATVPDEVKHICHIALRRDHEFVNTVHEGSEETHAQVKQTLMVASLDKQFSLLFALLKEHMADNVDYKVIVFCTTAMVTKLLANLLGELKLNVREIHSRKPQSYRTRVSDEFRKSKGIILVTSDVSARGVDYPDVSLVIQLGVPSDREQYIHRLGRTGRKGKEGQGILLLAPWEEFFSSSIKDLPITKDPLPSIDPEAKKKVEKALCNVEMKNKESAYQAWLGYYNSQKAIGKDKTRLVELANDFSRSMGLDDPPAIPKMVLGKMGLKNVPGLRSK